MKNHRHFISKKALLEVAIGTIFIISPMASVATEFDFKAYEYINVMNEIQASREIQKLQKDANARITDAETNLFDIKTKKDPNYLRDIPNYQKVNVHVKNVNAAEDQIKAAKLYAENIGRVANRRAAHLQNEKLRKQKTETPQITVKTERQQSATFKDALAAMEKSKGLTSAANAPIPQQPGSKQSFIGMASFDLAARERARDRFSAEGNNNHTENLLKSTKPAVVTQNPDHVAVSSAVASPLVASKTVTPISAALSISPQAPQTKHQHVIVGTYNSFLTHEGSASEPQESLVLTNQLGNTHGVLVTEDKVIVSGGAHSTNMVVDDDGVTFMSSQTGEAVVISGVADGMAPHDAANVGQVQGVVDAAVAPLHGRIDGIENAVQRLDQKINAVEKKLSGGVAMALALSQPVSFAPQAKSAVTGGVASYNGQTAMGFSFNRLVTRTETRRTMVSAGVAATTSGRSSASARIGASFSW